jgi:hypothetical protein
MKRIDLITGASRIRHALELLESAWRDNAEQWDDVVSRRFAERQLEPLVPKVKTALDAIGRMHQLMTEVQRDCEE